MCFMLKLRANRAALLAGVAGLALAGGVARAQDRVWNGGAGLWGTAANWTMPNVPDTFAERGVINAPGTYVVTMAAAYDLGGLLLGNASATLNVPPGFTQRGNADITNHGTINFNNTGANASTQFTVISSFSLLGSGQLVMNANAANIDTAYFYWNGGGESLTNGAGHTIRGTGNIYTVFNNLGTVNADRTGLILNFRNQPKSNSGTMTATNGGLLRFDGVSITQTATGILLANGGTVLLNSATQTGGTLTATAGSQVQASGTTFVGNATINGTFAVLGGSTVRMTPNIQNNGTILVNDNAANAATQWVMNSSATLNGPGDLRLNANAANLDTAYIYWNGGGEVLTNASTHLIHGTGNIYTFLTNNGTVRADVSGRTLQLRTQPKTNNGLMTAVNGANLNFFGCTITNTGGTVSAVGGSSTVTFDSTGLTGGTVTASGGGVVNTSNHTFDGVTLSGPINVLPGTVLAIGAAGLTDNSTLTLNSTGANASTNIRLNTTLSIGGNGTIVLNANAANLDTSYIYWNGGGEVLTHGANHTIRGSGNLYTFLTNNGTISADLPGKTLQLLGQAKTNNNVIRAINGGNLAISNFTLTQNSPGSLTATGAGSTISLNSCGVNGGVISASAGAVITSSNCTLNTLVTSGPLNVLPSTVLATTSGYTNNGTMLLNSTGANAGTVFRFNSSCTIDGSGTFVLNANAANLETSYLTWNGGGEIFTQAASHTVRGTGRIYVRFDNLGAIRADVPGRVLEITSGNAKTNRNLIQAENGGTLSFNGVNLTQTATGQVRAQGGTVSLINSNFTGGSFLSNSNSDLFTVDGVVTINGIYNATQMRVNPGSSLRASGSFTNAGNIVINASAANVGTLFAVNSSLTVDGPGRVLLNANAANLDASYLTWNGGGEVLTNGPQHAIAGTGRVYVRTTNQGTLAPGNGQDSIGLLDVRTVMNCTSTSVVDIELGGPTPTEFDRITGPASWALGGTLRIRTINGFVPNFGSSFDIITYGSRTGTFTDIDAIGWTVQYLADRVRIVAVCEPDVNQDGNADQGDIDYLINIIAGGSNPTGIDPDFNRDGNSDQGDIDSLVNAIAGGACGS